MSEKQRPISLLSARTFQEIGHLGLTCHIYFNQQLVGSAVEVHLPILDANEPNTATTHCLGHDLQTRALSGLYLDQHPVGVVGVFEIANLEDDRQTRCSCLLERRRVAFVEH